MNLRSEKVKEQVRRKIVAYATVLRQELVADTPIMTGQAKANWQASVGNPGSAFIGASGSSNNLATLAKPKDSIDYGAYGAIAQQVIDNYQVGQVLYVYSNLPYIDRLNGGSSRQAAPGFVESAVMKASAAVRR